MNNKKGFTFIELLITLAVLGICFLPLMNMFSVLISQTNYTSEITTARYLAQEKMEKLKNLNFTMEQLKNLGDTWDPPMEEPAILLDGQEWRVLTELDKLSEPLEVYVRVFKANDVKKRNSQARAVVELVTLFEDFEWSFLQ